MRRILTTLAAALLLAAVAVPMASAGQSTTTKHVDGTVRVQESNDGQEWLARFEIRTTPSGANVLFGYLELYGITPDANLGQIHEFSVDHVDYYRTSSGARGATLWMVECVIDPPTECYGLSDDYRVSDGSPDTFLANGGWSVVSGNISIYTTTDQNGQ
jgi:hypothetical protein